MTYDEQIQEDKHKLDEIKQTIKALQEKKSTITDTEKLKAINKQINNLQEKFGQLRKEIQCRGSYDKSIEREFIHSEISDD